MFPNRTRGRQAMHDVKIFGERNTATNALKQIIETNSGSRCAPSVVSEVDPRIKTRNRRYKRLAQVPGLRGLSNRLREADIDRVFQRASALESWKHAATNFGSVEAFAGVSVIVTVRNPASWLQSLCKNPYHVYGTPPAGLEAFIDHRWRPVARERLEARSYDPLELYAAKLTCYRAFFGRLDAAGIPWRLVPFEEIVTDQEASFARIRDLLRTPADRFTPLESSTKSKEKSRDYYQDYYGNERWRAEMGPVYDQVRTRFSGDLAADFGYRL